MCIARVLGLTPIPNPPIGELWRELLYAAIATTWPECPGHSMARIPLDSDIVIVFCALSELDWVVKVPVCRRLRLQAATVADLLTCAGL